MRDPKPKVHALKTLQPYFDAVESGVKTFEIRKNDRDFKVGDGLILREFDGERYTGRLISRKITYMTDYEQKPGYVVLGIKPEECHAATE